MSRLLITCGGTGGHIYPALSVAEEWVAQGGEVLFLGSKDGMEERLVRAAGYNLEVLKASPFKGLGALPKIKALYGLPVGVARAASLILSWKPCAVLGTGGYVSVPACSAAAALGKPVVLCEQNSVPGAANRLLARFASRICTSFLGTASYLPREKVVCTGNPVASAIVKAGATKPEVKALSRIVVIGGSGGARFLNRELFPALCTFAASHPELGILHQHGRGRRAELPESVPTSVEVLPYVEDMPGLLLGADLYIGRAGAGAIAELCVMGVPSILIPFPAAADNHQEQNARVLSRADAACLLLEQAFTPEGFFELLGGLLAQPQRLGAMSRNAKALGRPDAAAQVVSVVKEVCR